MKVHRVATADRTSLSAKKKTWTMGGRVGKGSEPADMIACCEEAGPPITCYELQYE